jgi:glycosyltransferase involved in cell wall biosynthesis
MKIRFYNHYAITPEHPGGTRHYDLGLALQDRGHEVSVYASGFNYSTFKETQSYGSAGYVRENVNGLDWVWVKTHPYTNNNIHRSLNMLSYAKGIYALRNKIDDDPDLIVGSTVHPFAAYAASRIARSKGIPFLFEIRDLWPQTMIDNGVWSERDPRALLFRRMEKSIVKHAAGVIALSPLTIDYLAERYAFPAEKIIVLPNGTRMVPAAQKECFAQEQMTLMYLGGIDSVHQLEDLFQAMALKPEIAKKVRVVMVGDGKERQELTRLARDLGLENVEWRGAVAKSAVPGLLEEADVLYLSTSKVLYGSENKLSEYMMAGRPIVTYTPALHNNPIEAIGCGMSAEYGNVGNLATTIAGMSEKKKEEMNLMGRKGQDYATNNLSWGPLSGQLMDFVSGCL